MNTTVLFMLFAAAFVNGILAQETSEDVQIPNYYIKVREETSDLDTLSDQYDDKPQYQIKIKEGNSDVQLSPIEMESQEPEISHGRFRRATCDLLSFSTKWGSLNHSACAAHCLALRRGFRGGRCIDGVCNCRR